MSQEIKDNIFLTIVVLLLICCLAESTISILKDVDLDQIDGIHLDGK